MSSIRSQLLIAALAGLVCCVALVAGFSTWRSHSETSERAINEARQEALAEAGRMNTLLAESHGALQGMSAALLALRAANAAGLRERVDEVVQSTAGKFPETIGFFAIWEPNALDGQDLFMGGASIYWYRDEQGQLQAIRDNAEASYDQDYYRAPVDSRRTVLSKPYEDVDIKVLMATLSTPIILDGRVLGVAGLDLSLSQLVSMTSSIQPYGTGYATLYANDASVLASPFADRMAKIDSTLPAPAVAAIQNGEPYAYQDEQGFAHFLEPITAEGALQPWALKVSVPLDAALAPVRTTALQSIALSVGLLLVFALVLSVLIGRLTRPLKAMEQHVARLSQGEGDLTQRITVQSRDEIGRSAGAINRFMASLAGLIGQVRDKGQQTVQTLGRLAEQIRGVRDQSAKQSDAATTTAASVEELTVSIGRIADAAGLR